MKTIGAFQAKTHFSEILAQVAEGQEFCITNRGREVALLISSKKQKKERAKRAFSTLKKFRKETNIGKLEEVLSWKDEGRK